jgi:hypothetical protein
VIAFWIHDGVCQIQPLAFSGPQATDGWVIDFLSYSQAIYGTYPGTKIWTQPMIANQPSSQGGTLTKVTNGDGGGPYPADHLYFGGSSPNPNTFGGTIKVSVHPLSLVKKVVLQVQITEAYGLDFYQPGGAPVLLVNTATSIPTPSIDQTQHEMIDQVDYTGTLEDLYLNTYRYEWDVSLIQVPITSIEIQMSAVQHAEIYALQVDQGVVATNPSYPPSLKILTIEPVVYQNNVSSVGVTFEGEPAKAYLLDYNEALATSGWSSDGGSVSTGTGIFSHTFRASGDHRIAWQRQLFFRARWP